MPQTRGIGPPDFNKTKLAKGPAAPQQSIPKIAQVPEAGPSSAPLLATRFEAVPNTYLAGSSSPRPVATAPFTPIRQAETAVAMASPMPDAVAPEIVVAEASTSAPAGEYIHIGMLWSEDQPQALETPPTEIVSNNGLYTATAMAYAPPKPVLPIVKPIETVVVSSDAPLVTPLPRLPAVAEPQPAVIEVAALAPPVVEMPMPEVVDAAPVAPPEPQHPSMASPAPPRAIAEPILTDEMLMDASAHAFTADALPRGVSGPLKPLPDSATVISMPQPAEATGAETALSPADCFVNRGSNERMILVCQGNDVSPSQVFRAVTEGESAFRGLRDFDTADRVIGTYGFNTTRFRAISQGPSDATDLAFLRALRRSRRSVQVKGRPFDMYLMKGDRSVATVLIEQAMAPERSAIQARN